MGNHLEATPHSPSDASLLLQLKERTLADVSECTVIIAEDYPDCQCINYDQFTDIFGALVDDPEPFFLLLQNENDINGVTDTYEALAVFATFCKDRFEKKVNFIFDMFDFNKNLSLEISELTLTLQCVLRGLCKFVHITPPTYQSFEDESRKIFNLIDRDHNELISRTEFCYWIRHSLDLHYFLLKHAGIQTYESLRLKYREIYIEYSFFFNTALDPEAKGFADAVALKKAVEKREKGAVKQSDIDFLFDIMKNTTRVFLHGREPVTENLISKDAYEAIMKGWCSFMASDLNRDNVLVIPELYSLLWLYEEKEPSEERVRLEMGEMCKNGREEITREDWMKNICVMNGEGKYAIRPSMKKLFDKYDKDGSGFLTVDELRLILEEKFQNYVATALTHSIQENISDIITSLTEEIFGEMDSNASRSVGWEEFKKFIDIAWKKIIKLRRFLDKNLEDMTL